MSASSTRKSITAGELCKKARDLEKQIHHLVAKACGMPPATVIQYQAGDLLDTMLESLEKVPDDELVQPGVCPPPV